MRIEEGRLIERECPHCGGIERRAFGESESPRGELASYAFGWTANHEDDKVAHLTVGIGAGNPGGGSFHAEIRVRGGKHAFRLVDRPFEDVPEGGPDLTREQGLKHSAVRYVWWVADEAMAQDRRAWWMLHWLYGTPALATMPVVEGSARVRHVARARDDEMWQLLCGTVAPDDPQTFHLHHAIDRDPTLLEVLDLQPGESAERSAEGWLRERY